MGIRKNAIHMTATERDNFLAAVLMLKNTIANPGDPPAQQISVFDQFVAMHTGVWSLNIPGVAFPVDQAHSNPGFGPWHRYYLRRFELALQAVNPSVNLPYWDWTDHIGTQTILFQDNFMGPNGGVGGVGGGTIQSGYFAFNAPDTGGNPTPLPAWWPSGLSGWQVRSSLAEGWGTTLQRFLSPFTILPTQANILVPLGMTDYEVIGPDFRSALEQAPLHNSVHGWVGGHMGTASPARLQTRIQTWSGRHSVICPLANSGTCAS